MKNIDKRRNQEYFYKCIKDREFILALRDYLSKPQQEITK